MNEAEQAAIVFDLDGTLIDTSGDIVFSANHVREELGLSPLKADKILSMVGRGNPYFLSLLTGLYENDGERFNDVREKFQIHYREHQTEHSRPYPGIATLLEALAKDYHLYVLSNKPHEAVIREIESQGLSRYFESIWGAGFFLQLKPNPVGIEEALQASGAAREKCIMVGDMDLDVETARAARVLSVFVKWGFGALRGQDPRPSAIAESVSDLEPLIRRLLNEPRTDS